MREERPRIITQTPMNFKLQTIDYQQQRVLDKNQNARWYTSGGKSIESAITLINFMPPLANLSINQPCVTWWKTLNATSDSEFEPCTTLSTHSNMSNLHLFYIQKNHHLYHIHKAK